jgi:hypothetical protein
MALFLHKKNSQQSSRNNHFGVRGLRNKFSLRPKTIVAVLSSALVVYVLSSFYLIVHVHRLNHVENNLLKEADATAGTNKFYSKVDNENNDKKNLIEEGKNDKSGEDKRNENDKIPFIPATKGENVINEENLQANEVKEIIRDQETKPNPKKKGGEPKPSKKGLQYLPKPHGHMVSPVIIIEGTGNNNDQNPTSFRQNVPEDQILTAYLEVTDRSAWSTKPLPIRNVKAEDLVKTQFPKLSSCSKLPEQWPVDDYPDADPFLPWIHDAFPTDDGKFIQFVAQNRRRCHSGTTEDEEIIYNHTAPQVALFQHIPLKKMENSTEKELRYRLCSHEDADPESIATRFICRFKPSGDITFSEFNNDYEWTAFQKRQPVMFHENKQDNYQIQTSQLIFRCPVPDHLIEQVRTGESVLDDWATIFVDLIPVRTPVRYGPPDEFFVPRYATATKLSQDMRFDPHKEWGEEHILPKLEESGRWENIPICKPSLMTYEPQALKGPKRNEKKKHHLVSCLWASTGYTTRGNRYAINDGQRRLLEWITFNKILGFDHFYIYDNSGAFTNQSSLQPIADLFPDDVTVIKWPSRVCNNNPNNVNSVGERSSQYAAEASCQLRFGSYTNWIGQFDIDEYLIPMGNFSSILPLLGKLEDEGNKIISFASWRAWPRRTHIK